MKRRFNRQSGLLLGVGAFGSGGGGGTVFHVPTTPSTSTADKVPYAPNFIAGPTGLDPYRPWWRVVIDGETFFGNGWDTPRRWDRSLSTWAYMGSQVPTTFGLALSSAGSPAAIPTGRTARYYLVFANSTLDKESAPQVLSIANASGSTRDVTVTWTAAEAAVDQDVARVYRALNGTDDFKRVAEIAKATATYLDVTPDATLRTNGSLSWDGSLVDGDPGPRTTFPPAFLGCVESNGVLFAWTRDDDFLYYSEGVVIGNTFRADDFPDRNILPVGLDDGGGPPTAFYPYQGSDIVFKRRGIYEKTGDDVTTWTCRGLNSSRGAFNQRCVLPLDRRFLVLDELGVYAWTPGSYPGVVGAIEEMANSPFQPLLDRMNLSAANTFHAVQVQEEGNVVFWIALDNEPIADTGLVFNYATNKFVGIMTSRHPAYQGRLDDAQGKAHLLFGCDMGYLWEDDYAQSEGVFAGTNAVAATGETGLQLLASTAAFDSTVAAGGAGTPQELYTSAGVVADVNRVYSIDSGTTFTRYLYPTTAYASGDELAIGVIPGVAETGTLGFDSRNFVWVKELRIEFEYGVAGAIRVDTALDDGSFISKGEYDLNPTNPNDSTGSVVAIVPLSNTDRCKRWRLRVSQRYANLGFSIRAVHVLYEDEPGWRS